MRWGGPFDTPPLPDASTKATPVWKARIEVPGARKAAAAATGYGSPRLRISLTSTDCCKNSRLATQPSPVPRSSTASLSREDATLQTSHGSQHKATAQPPQPAPAPPSQPPSEQMSSRAQLIGCLAVGLFVSISVSVSV